MTAPTAPAKVPGTGKLVFALVMALLVPILIVGIGVAVFAGNVSEAGKTMNEIEMGSQGTIELVAGDYQVYEAGTGPGAELTVQGPTGELVNQTMIGSTQTVTVNNRSYRALADIKIPVTGTYSVLASDSLRTTDGVMAIGPSVGKLLGQAATYIGGASALAFLWFLVWAIIAIRILMKRSRAKKQGPSGGYPSAGPGYAPPGPGHAPAPTGYPAPTPGAPPVAPGYPPATPGYPPATPGYPPPGPGSPTP